MAGDNQTALLEAIVNKFSDLTDEEIRWWIDNKKDFDKFLVGLNPASCFPVPVLKYNRDDFALNSPDKIRGAFYVKGLRIAEWTNDVLNRCDFTQPSGGPLVIISVGELGLEDNVSAQDIYHRAERLGLVKCSGQVGPLVMLNNRDVSDYFNTVIHVGMEPILNFKNQPCVFTILAYPGNTLTLGSTTVGTEVLYKRFQRWIFVNPRYRQ